MSRSVTKAAFTPVFILTLCIMGTAQAQEPAFKAAIKKSNQRTNDDHKGEKELTEVLVQLELIYDVTFAYQKKFLSGKFIINHPLINSDLDTYLKEILIPEKLDFKKIGDGHEQIYVIFPIEDAPLSAIDSSPERETGANETELTKITGIVKTYAGDSPLAGVNVIVKGTRLGTITDKDGRFSVNVPSNARARLLFSFIGFSNKEIEIVNEEQVLVAMDETCLPLSEIIVTALGIKRDQKALGYSVTSINGAQLTNSANTNFGSALYGKIPGLRIRTAPGGATSAVTIQVRGFNSLNYNTQPLYIIDGVPMRDGNEKGVGGVNTDGYYTDQRLRGNGILDISTMDIETLTALKGASATALYGSDASNGAIVITTKNHGVKAGMGVELNYSLTSEKVAFTPRYQNTYGPGYDRETNLSLGATSDGWVPVDTDGDGVPDAKTPLFRAYGQFGPKMDGQDVIWWDGSTRRYTPQPDNYKDFYRTGYNSQFNVSVQNQLGKVGYRLSYSRNEYAGIQVGGKLVRNIINLNSTIKLNDRLTADWMLNFSNSLVHNRPYKINRLTDSYSGFFSRAEKMDLLFNKYKTSEDYKWVPSDQAQRNPEEALRYATPRGFEVMNLLWRQLRDQEDETQNRLISSFTLNYKIAKDLQLRGRVGNDITAADVDTRQHNEYPTSYNTNFSTGSFGRTRGNYAIHYADALLSYSKNVNADFSIGLNTGFQIKDERYKDEYISTSGGLAIANKFDFSNSYYPQLITTNANTSILKYAYIGIASVSYKNILFLEATGRQEYSSTLPPSHNGYFYPSINTGFIFSDAVQLPAFLNFGKLRASYGVVGNAPPVYESNILYNLTPIQTPGNGSVISGSPNGTLHGNSQIRPERKYEAELGLEMRMFKNRMGVDLTYYVNRIEDQILKLDLPTSTGAGKALANVGELHGYGFEAGLNAILLDGNFKWTSAINASFSTTKLSELINGIDQLVFSDMEGSAMRVIAEKGQPIGNIYTFPRKTDDNGNHIINSDGLYVMDKSRYVKAGNLLPKITGGLYNIFKFKNFNLSALMDYSFGGQIISSPLKYALGAGMYESTMQYRDAAHGGLSYYISNDGEKIQLNNEVPTAPNGTQVFHDGVLLKGVTEEGTENTKIIEASTYYLNTFGWGNDSWNEKGSIYDNSFVKVRELVLSYNIPKSLVKRLHFQKFQVSLVGRNMFYIWRTLKNLDPESTIGTTWLSQGIDEGSNAATRSYGFALNIGF